MTFTAGTSQLFAFPEAVAPALPLLGAGLSTTVPSRPVPSERAGGAPRPLRPQLCSAAPWRMPPCRSHLLGRWGKFCHSRPLTGPLLIASRRWGDGQERTGAFLLPWVPRGARVSVPEQEVSGLWPSQPAGTCHSCWPAPTTPSSTPSGLLFQTFLQKSMSPEHNVSGADGAFCF